MPVSLGVTGPLSLLSDEADAPLSLDVPVSLGVTGPLSLLSDEADAPLLSLDVPVSLGLLDHFHYYRMRLMHHFYHLMCLYHLELLDHLPLSDEADAPLLSLNVPVSLGVAGPLSLLSDEADAPLLSLDVPVSLGVTGPLSLLSDEVMHHFYHLMCLITWSYWTTFTTIG